MTHCGHLPLHRHDDLDDTFAIAEILIDDTADLVHKAVGGFLREAGKHDVGRLTAVLDCHAAVMNRTALRYAIKHDLTQGSTTSPTGRPRHVRVATNSTTVLAVPI